MERSFLMRKPKEANTRCDSQRIKVDERRWDEWKKREEKKAQQGEGEL